MVANKQNSSLVGFYKTREAVYGQTPVDATWRTREPNSFDDMGGEYTKVARSPFSPSRQRKKGTTTDLDASGGWNEDFTQDNMYDEMEEFFFARKRTVGEYEYGAPLSTNTFTASAATSEATTAAPHGYQTGDGPFQVSAATTLPAPLVASTDYWVIRVSATTFKFSADYDDAIAGTAITLTTAGTGALTITPNASVTVADGFTVSHVPANISAGSIIQTSGFGNPANNGLFIVASATASTIKPVAAVVAENPAPKGAKIAMVGERFASGTLVMALVGGRVRLTSSGVNFTDMGLVEGSWLYVGGDDANTYFVDGAGEPIRGYARISEVTSTEIFLDKTTFAGQSSTGTGKTVELYFSTVIKNEEDPDDIVQFSSTIERTVGNDDDGTQSEYLTGAVANELTMTYALADKIAFDLAYVAQKTNTRTGAEGPLIKRPNNTVLPAFNQDAFNTTSNIARIRLSRVEPDTLNPDPIFALIREWSVTINNNVTGAKAQGILGAFDVNVGNFDVDAEMTAYFQTVEAIHAVRCNWDMTFDAILAKNNAGFYLDLPLISLGGGQLDIEMNEAIMIPLENAAAESPFGHTALIGWFGYLPDAAMPDQDC